MGRMTRTQISLQDRQYRYLKARATETGSSLSAVLREMIDEKIGDADRQAPRLLALAGMYEGGGATGAEHDRLLAEHLGRTKTRAAE